MKNYFLLLLVILLCGGFTAPKTKILIIGDSISIGYTPFVKRALQDKAMVKHNAGNAGDTPRGLENIEKWLEGEDWDVILFNWGLWDLCYRHPDATVYGNRDKINGKITSSPEAYSENLSQLVDRLKQTNAKLIFICTTYVPEGEAGRYKGDEIKYNKVAKQIMKKNNVLINDIYKASRKIHKKHKKADGDVHFTEKGYELLSKKIVEFIDKNTDIDV